MFQVSQGLFHPQQSFIPLPLPHFTFCINSSYLNDRLFIVRPPSRSSSTFFTYLHLIPPTVCCLFPLVNQHGLDHGQPSDQRQAKGGRRQSEASALWHLFSLRQRKGSIRAFSCLGDRLLLPLTDASQNKQIDVALNSFLASRALSSPSPKLSEEGKHLVKDVREVVEQAKILLLTKNDGDLLQDFIWQTQHLGSGGAQLPGAPIDKNTAQQHGNQALDGLRTLGTLILSNGQFRKLCMCYNPIHPVIANRSFSERCYYSTPGHGW